MIARLLYVAVGLCLLGTRPEHAATRPAPRLEAAAPAAPALEPRGAKPADFAIPRNSR